MVPLITSSQDRYERSVSISNHIWDSLLNLHNKRHLTDTQYLNRIVLIAPDYVRDTTLKSRLTTFQQIAWSRSDYAAYRERYFTFLANNATFTYKAGASIYYLQKREEELMKIKPYINSLSTNSLMFFIYGKSPNAYDRCTEEYQKVFPFIKTLPESIEKDSIPRRTCENALNILRAQASIYSKKNDSAGVQEILHLSEAMIHSMGKKKSRYEFTWEQSLYSVNMVHFYSEVQNKNLAEALNILSNTYSATLNSNSNSKIWKIAAQGDVLQNFIDFFLAQGMNDSAAHYLTKMKAIEGQSLSEIVEDTGYLLAHGKLKASEGNYEEAYKDIFKAFEINDSLITVKTTDINNNLYAQLAAESSRQELKFADVQRQERNTIIAVIASILIMAFSILLYRLKMKQNDSTRRIEVLNNASQLQIAELQTKADMIQRKLGMDLHDNISANIAHISHMLEKEILDTTDGDRRKQLSRIADLCRSTYQSTRLKSHEWFRHGLAEEHASFSSMIHKIVDNALPEDLYKKQIEIDDDFLHAVTFQVRIELLKIIQEAIINILKHSRATSVQIFIYRDEGKLVLLINDNGIGFKTVKVQHSKGLGIQSMHTRISELKGDIEINSSFKGTEILVTIPS